MVSITTFKMNDYYTYQKTLEIVEKFMIDTRIREYCESICKGVCCGDCYDSDYACFKNEGRRLPCSFFVCKQLRNHFDRKIKNMWYAAAVVVERRVESHMGVKSCYFNVNTPKVQRAFRIQKSLLDDLVSNEDGINSIRNIMNELIDNKTRVKGMQYT